MKDLDKKIQDLDDFPIFKYWDVNQKQFEHRSLNRMSSRFITSLVFGIKNIKRLKPKDVEYSLQSLFVGSVINAYFYNRSYEAEGPRSYGGGDDSIQEQFICWALNKPVKEHRANKHSYFNYDLIDSPVITEFIKNSELLKLVKEFL